MYVITGAKKFSYYFSLVVNTIMNVIVLKGVIDLTKEIAPTSFLAPAFQVKPPFIVATAIVLFFLNRRSVPMSMLSAINQIKTKYIMLIVYFIVAMLLLGYEIAEGRYF